MNTGGPAYPTSNYGAIVPISTGYSEGMSLRDYFAAKAIIAYHADGEFSSCEDVANWCYRLADAMLRAREA
jgi:hypothetical protein